MRPFPARSESRFSKRGSTLKSSCQPASFSRCLVVLLLIAASLPAWPQGADNLSHAKKLYVDAFGQNRGAAETRSQIVRRLEKSHEVEVVQDPSKADAVLRGTEQIWTIGHVTLSPRSHTVTQPVYEGFLSVEVIGRNHQPLWSYMVTPSRFPWGGVADDLAKQVVSRLLNDFRTGTYPVASSGSAAPANPRATLKAPGRPFPRLCTRNGSNCLSSVMPTCTSATMLSGPAREFADCAKDKSISGPPRFPCPIRPCQNRIRTSCRFRWYLAASFPYTT